MLVFLYRVAPQKSTAAPSEETTAVPPGKTPNNMEKEKKKITKFNLVVSNAKFTAFFQFSCLLWYVKFG